MKRAIYLSGIVLLSASFLWGCGGSDDENLEATVNAKVTDDSGNKDDSGEIGNQVGLEIGEMGTVKDTLGTYEVTVHSVEMKKVVKGYEPANDLLYLANISIKNVGENSIKAGEVIQSVDLIDGEGGGGMRVTNRVKQLDGFEGKGTVNPGETVNGVMLFDMLKTKSYKLVWNNGFAGTLSNKVTWEFDASEAK